MRKNEIMEIRSQNFEVAKKELRELAQKFQVNYEFQKVKTDAGLFGWFDHSVTGAELNNSLSEIQKTFITVGDSLSTIQDQFEKVYTMCDAMDSDYIKRILENLKLANKGIEDAKSASEDALQANKKAVEAHNKLQRQHIVLTTTVKKLEDKSKKLDTLEKQISDIKFGLKAHTKTAEEQIKLIRKNEKNFEKLQATQEKAQKRLENLESQISSEKGGRRVRWLHIALSSVAVCLSVVSLLIVLGIL